MKIVMGNHRITTRTVPGSVGISLASSHAIFSDVLGGKRRLYCTTIMLQLRYHCLFVIFGPQTTPSPWTTVSPGLGPRRLLPVPKSEKTGRSFSTIKEKKIILFESCQLFLMHPVYTRSLSNPEST